MRKLLILAFLLYDIIALATRTINFDYDDIEASKRHAMLDERRNWRKNSLSKPADSHREWERRKYEYDNPRFMEEVDSKGFNGIDRQRDVDFSSGFNRQPRGYEEDKQSMPPAMKSSELPHPLFPDKDQEKKTATLNCDRPHERYESCFAGCASVTCDNPRERMQPCYPFCEAGCICVHPYVRDDRTHKCVLPDECTKGLKGVPDLGEDNTAS